MFSFSCGNLNYFFAIGMQLSAKESLLHLLRPISDRKTFALKQVTTPYETAESNIRALT